MASTNLSLSYSQNIWDVACEVEENYASGNYRSITLSVGVRATDFSGGRDGGYSVECDEGGDISERSCVVPGSSQSYFTVYEETFDVYVAPGQTYADISFSFEIHFWSSSANATRSLTGTITKIKGLSVVSSVSISSAKDVYFGDNCSITWTPAASTFAYKLKFVLGSYEYTTGIISPNSTSAYTYSGLTIPLSAANNIPDSEYGIMSVTITQYKDSSASETIGSSKTSKFTVTLKDDVVPSISTYDAALDNSSNATVASWGIGLVGQSKIKITASANGVYGSTIQSYSISGDYSVTVAGSTLNYTGATISTSGNKKFLITCTDSRGRTSTSVTTDIISILPYTNPRMTSLSSRKEEYGDSDISNDRMVVTATWEYDPVNGYNTASGVAYYKESSATDWIPHAGSVQNNEPFTLTSLVLDDTKSYNIKVVVTDAVGNSSDKSSFSSTTTVLLDFKAGGDGLGVGKICERPGMEVSMNATFYNEVNLLRESNTYELEEYIKMLATSIVSDSLKNIDTTIVEAVYPVGSIYISTSNTNPLDLFGVGTWEQIQDRFLLAAGNTYAAGSTGGTSEVTLTVNEMPSHTHTGVRRSDGDISGTGSTGASSGSGGTVYETNATGGGRPHNNMPPYLVAYIWKRTA